MGKGILITVLGISAIITIIMVNLNANSSAGVESTVDFYESAQARLIANSGIEVYLEKMRRDKNLTGNFLNNQLMEGMYDLYISGPDTLLKVKAVGRFDDNVHTSLVTAKRSLVEIPDINYALYISSTNLEVNLNGNVEIDGNDHNPDGTLGSQPPVPGIGVDNPTDSAYIINNIKPKIAYDIKGEGGSPSVSTIDCTVDWMELTQNFIFAADITLPSGTYSTGTVLGTPSEPKITYITGDVNLSGTAEGDGLMIVNGNLTMSGQFKYRGVIIAYGTSTITTKVIGDAGVFGGIILVGENIDIQATGNSSFFYSSQAIQNAKDNLKSSRFDILSWWE